MLQQRCPPARSRRPGPMTILTSTATAPRSSRTALCFSPRPASRPLPLAMDTAAGCGLRARSSAGDTTAMGKPLRPRAASRPFLPAAGHTGVARCAPMMWSHAGVVPARPRVASRPFRLATHGCGLRSDDTVTCWGDNRSGQADAPSGTFEVTRGCAVEPLRFCPDDSVTRGQMAAFLARAFELAAGPPSGFVDVHPDTPSPPI